MKVLIRQRAEEDLARIYGYIATRNSDAAERFRMAAEKALALLAQHPELGRSPVGKRATHDCGFGLSAVSTTI